MSIQSIHMWRVIIWCGHALINSHAQLTSIWGFLGQWHQVGSVEIVPWYPMRPCRRHSHFLTDLFPTLSFQSYKDVDFWKLEAIPQSRLQFVTKDLAVLGNLIPSHSDLLTNHHFCVWEHALWHRQRLRFFLKIATPWNHIDPDFSISRPLRFQPTEVKSLRDRQGKANPHRTDVGNGLQFILSFFQPHISYYFVHGEFITL